MDSGNSGSMQSSSGGDEEFDSSFLNSSSHFSSLSNPQNPFPQSSFHHNNHPSSSIFDPLSTYLDAFSRSPQPPNANSLQNLDILCPISLRSEPNCTNITPLMAPSSSSNHPNSSLQGSAPRPPLTHSDQTHIPVQRNSKKRTRASRRAPTTVLTTDTSNFRAMVQEFTGIPAPPFSAAATHFPRNRFDLFNTAFNTRSASYNLDPAPSSPYLLRPFAQRVNPKFASINTINATTTTTTIAPSNSPSSSNHNHHLQAQNLLDLQNPLFTFQSPLQSPPPKYPLANVPIFGGKSQGILEEFDMNHGHVNPNLVTSEGLLLRSDNNQSKVNYLASSSSDFHAEKGSENVSSRGEGMVDSWICSSD